MSSKIPKSYLSSFYNTTTIPINNNNTNQHFEFDEQDLWNNSCSSSLSSTLTAESKSLVLTKRAPRTSWGSLNQPLEACPSSASSTLTPELKSLVLGKRAPRTSWGSLSQPLEACSVPVNIPDWSKIIGKEENYDWNSDDNEDDDELEERLPPHEYVAKKLARSRIVPFSVHEGVGRTLKGRDLSRVRNAVWKQTGFED